MAKPHDADGRAIPRFLPRSCWPAAWSAGDGRSRRRSHETRARSKETCPRWGPLLQRPPGAGGCYQPGPRSDPERFGRLDGWIARFRRPGSPPTEGPLVIDPYRPLRLHRGGAQQSSRRRGRARPRSDAAQAADPGTLSATTPSRPPSCRRRGMRCPLLSISWRRQRRGDLPQRLRAEADVRAGSRSRPQAAGESARRGRHSSCKSHCEPSRSYIPAVALSAPASGRTGRGRRG